MKNLFVVLSTSLLLIFTTYANEPVKSPNGMKLAKKKDHSKDKQEKKTNKKEKKANK